MKDHYTTFAGYNAWANRRLYDAAAQLSDAEVSCRQGRLLQSMHGTLNHLLATDRIWMKRFTGEGEGAGAAGRDPARRLAELRTAREAEDRRITGYIGGLDEERLKGVIRYRRVSTPDEFVQKLMPALDHWFNHQTHHRGHAHMILTSLGRKAPELDLLYYQREVDASRA
jgi:uncharacterized damage-inducible protein DinB